MLTTSSWPKWLAFLVVSLIASRVNGDGVRAGNNNQDINKERDLQTSQVAVGAYYYPWYGNDFHKGGGYLREKLNQRPELGEYNDKFSSIIQRHLDWSRLANINLWVTSWWGPNLRVDVTTRNSILAHEDLQDHQIALFYETQGRMKEKGSRTWSTYQVESDFQFIADNYFSHSNYYHIDNKPVVFISLSRGLAVRGILDETIALMRRAAASKGYDEIYFVGDHTFGSPPTAASFQPFEVLDAVTNVGVYGPLSSGASYAGQQRVDSYYDKQDSWRSQAQDQDCGFIPSVIPGFNDRGARNNRRHALSRQLSPGAPFGSLFQASLERAIEQVDEKAGNCLMVNSFNQWHHDTQIEPVVGITTIEPAEYTTGLEYQGYGDMYLRMLQQLTTSTTPQPTSSPTSQPTSSPTSESTPSPTTAQVFDVLIIGAGWAGLGAGSSLRNQGIDNFEILEGRDTIGGRSRTVYDFADDLAVEMGSAWTYGGTEVHQMLVDMRIPFGEINYDRDEGFGLYQSGNFQGERAATGEITGAERRQLIDNVWWDEFVRYSQRQTRNARNSGNDRSYQQILDDFLEQNRYPINSKTRQFLQTMVHQQIQLEYAAPLDEISAGYIGNSVNECIFCGSYYYVPVQGGGFDKVLAPLADPMADKIQLSHKVTKIEYSDNQPARVTYIDTSNGSTNIKLAERVLVTVPLGVLKANSIEFVPGLPRRKRDAISYIGFGVLNKCIFYWENASSSWWPNGREWLALVTDQDATSGIWTTFFNDRELGNGDHFVLSGWTGGDNAVAVEDQPDEDIVAQVLGNLRAMLGENVPKPSKYVITRWAQDEFARGSYSFPPVGPRRLVNNARRDLGARVGTRLFWAGEATDESWYGTTVGAYRSGTREADRIRRSLD